MGKTYEWIRLWVGEFKCETEKKDENQARSGVFNLTQRDANVVKSAFRKESAVSVCARYIVYLGHRECCRVLAVVVSLHPAGPTIGEGYSHQVARCV